MRSFASRCACLVGLAGFLAVAYPARAQSTVEERLRKLEENAAEEDKQKRWYDVLEIKGDLRLRYEGFSWDNHFDDGSRNRFRYRLRFGIIADLHETLEVGMELRSGNSLDPVSDNESFDTGGTKDEIAIAQAYAHWKPHESVWFRAGKFSPNGLWHVSDMQWDDDAVVNGFMEAIDWDGDGVVKHLDVRAYQFQVEESSSGDDSAWFGFQGGPTFWLSDVDSLLVGVGYDHITNPERVARNSDGFSPDGLFGGNGVTNLVIFDEDGNAEALVSEFKTFTLYAQWSNKSSKQWPIKAAFYWYKNTGAGDEVGIDPTVGESSAGTGKDNDDGWYLRIQVGDYKEFKQMAFRYSRYDSKPDAIFYHWMQSDTVRASNVDAHRFDWRLGMPLKGYINFTWYNSRPKVGDDDTMNRWQLDYVFRF